MRIIKINKPLEEKILILICSGIAFSISFNTIINSVLCLALLLFWLVFQEKKIVLKSTESKLLFILSAFFIFTVIGILYSNNIKEALFRTQQKTALMFFPLIFSTIVIDFNKLFEQIKKYFILGIFFSCIYCLINSVISFYQTKSTASLSGNDLVKSLDIYPYLLSLSCLISIIMLVNDFKNSKLNTSTNYKPKLTLFLILFFSFIILLISNRQIIFLYLLNAMIYGFNIIKNKKIFYSFLIGIITILSISIVYIPALNQKTKDIFDTKENTIKLDQNASLGKSWNGIAIRKAIWQCSLDPIRENLLIGVGTGDAQDELQKAYENHQFYFASRYNTYNAHNQYLQTLVASGVIGLIFLIISIVYPIIITKIDLYYTSIAICFLFIFLTESVLETNKGIVIFSFLNTLLIFYKIKRST